MTAVHEFAKRLRAAYDYSEGTLLEVLTGATRTSHSRWSGPSRSLPGQNFLPRPFHVFPVSRAAQEV